MRLAEATDALWTVLHWPDILAHKMSFAGVESDAQQWTCSLWVGSLNAATGWPSQQPAESTTEVTTTWTYCCSVHDSTIPILFSSGTQSVSLQWPDHLADLRSLLLMLWAVTTLKTPFYSVRLLSNGTNSGLIVTEHPTRLAYSIQYTQDMQHMSI